MLRSRVATRGQDGCIALNIFNERPLRCREKQLCLFYIIYTLYWMNIYYFGSLFLLFVLKQCVICFDPKIDNEQKQFLMWISNWIFTYP